MDKFERSHRRRQDKYTIQLSQIYDKYIRDVAVLAIRSGYTGEKPFYFKDYPNIKASADELFDKMYNEMITSYQAWIVAEWGFGNDKSDILVNQIFKGVPKDKLLKYYQRNTDAMEVFLKRNTNGMKLSDRIWRNTLQFRDEIQLVVGVGMENGTSAAKLARETKQYLNEPDNLFRRVRNKFGNLVLSKAAKAYHPGQGISRSSTRNALRMARTETQMSYHEADFERMQQLDFIVGYEVRRSSTNPYSCDLCDSLAGFYPKTFKWLIWHPNCRCYIITILKTREELDADIDNILSGSPITSRSMNMVKLYPVGFNKYIERIKNKPYAFKGFDPKTVLFSH